MEESVLLPKNDVFKWWKEYSNDLIEDDDTGALETGAVGLEVRRAWIRCEREAIIRELRKKW